MAIYVSLCTTAESYFPAVVAVQHGPQLKRKTSHSTVTNVSSI